MSTKLINSISHDLPTVEVRLKGPGAISVALYDGLGNALLTKRWVVSGTDGVEMRSRLPLSLRTKTGLRSVVPVLIHQTNSKQAITFDGHDPASMTAERSRTIKLSKASLSKIQAAAKLAAARSRDAEISPPIK